MSRWQRRARLLIALFAIGFVIVVALGFRRKVHVVPQGAIERTDPKAVVETTGGTTQRFKGTREDVGVEYEKLLTYQDGSTRMLGVTVRTASRGSATRSFTVTAKQGEVGKDESAILLTGDVVLRASDGLEARTERATYVEKDGLVTAPGPVVFSRGRMAGGAQGMTYDKNADTITFVSQAVVRVAPDAHGLDGADISAGTAVFNRRDRMIRFDGDARVLRGGRVVEADQATAHLSDDEQHVESLELRGNSRITAGKVTAGGLRALTGRDMNLKYAPDGETLEHAFLAGAASIQIAGDAGGPGRQIAGETIDITLGPDGSTPTALGARDNIVLTFPAEQNVGARTIRARALDAKGDASRGLTSARFTDDVQYREVNGATERQARSAVLDAALKPGFGAIEEARFSRGVRFGEGSMFATAAEARYVLDRGVLELSGTEPGNPMPHMLNERIAVDAERMEVTLAGPKVKAAGAVKSVLQPNKSGDKSQGHLPAMLKQDQPVNVTGDALDYDGSASTARYTGHAQLWQAETTVRADVLVIDDSRGDLSGEGAVATSVVLEQTNKETAAKERVRSLGASKTFKYEDAPHRATYTTDAHLTGPEGEVTADIIELYLKPSGDELDRAEAYTNVTLRETERRTTGDRLTYFAGEERYVATGRPVKIVDECQRETIGRTLIFYKSTDTILVDGNQRIRTQTKGGGKCPGT